MAFSEFSEPDSNGTKKETAQQRAAELAVMLEAVVPELRETLLKSDGIVRNRIGRAMGSIASIYDAYKPEDFR